MPYSKNFKFYIGRAKLFRAFRIYTTRIFYIFLLTIVCLISIVACNSYLKSLVVNYIEQYSAKAGYVVNDIEIVHENSSEYCVDPTDLIQSYKSKSIFLTSSEELISEVEKIDCIDQISVRKVFPSKLLVQVNYKMPVAIWNERGKFYFVTGEGIKLNIAQSANLEKFIFITGEHAPANVPSLIKFVSIDPSVYEKIDKAVWVGNRRWDIVFSNGAKVLLPEENPEAAWNKFVGLQKDHSDFVDWKFKSVDFRVPNKVYVR